MSLLLALLASCSGLQDHDDPGIDVSPTAVRGVLATAAPEISTTVPVTVTVAKNVMTPTPLPKITETIPQTSMTAAVTDVPSSGFSSLRFSLTAGGAEQNDFPAGTEEVYALWEYVGMSPSDKIRRIWFRDDQIWLTRDEGWNWGEYGSDGTMRDISVYDNEGSGLPLATYRLQLYVNDELQEEAIFVILSP